MKVKDLIEMLKGLEEYDILFSSDEELNLLRARGEVAVLDTPEKTAVLYGFDGSEVEITEITEVDENER